MTSYTRSNTLGKAKKTASKTLIFIFLMIMLIIMVVPFLWMLSASLKYNQEIFSSTSWIPQHARWSNYKDVWTQINFPVYYLNTIKLSVVITTLQLFTCSCAAYAFSRLHFPGRDKLFLVYLATMMVPWQAIMIPQFVIIKSMGLYNTHWSLILVNAFSVFGAFLLRQFMLGLPTELSEAARIDGCNEFQIYWRIIMPLTKPSLATLTVFTFTFVWNDYLAPMIYLSDDNLKTIQLGLTFFRSTYSAEYGLIMAGTVCSLIPIIAIYAFAQKYLVKGVAFTGLKG
ncbi:MAG: carbohydrate ABC transporter permease [Oscillospiraceae bacterium]|jgi:multiple sugar transport system permease protein|nr:carbohydrate ABC transporter permease [Oscillospiraceae bacterium]